MIKRGETLSGKLSAESVLSARITTSGSINGTISKATGYDDYIGDYEVIPKVEAQTMYTKDKHMTDNVEIKGIPIFSTSNSAGGNTVYIAKEVI